MKLREHLEWISYRSAKEERRCCWIVLTRLSAPHLYQHVYADTKFKALLKAGRMVRKDLLERTRARMLG